MVIWKKERHGSREVRRGSTEGEVGRTIRSSLVENQVIDCPKLSVVRIHILDIGIKRYFRYKYSRSHKIFQNSTYLFNIQPIIVQEKWLTGTHMVSHTLASHVYYRDGDSLSLSLLNNFTIYYQKRIFISVE